MHTKHLHYIAVSKINKAYSMGKMLSVCHQTPYAFITVHKVCGMNSEYGNFVEFTSSRFKV